ncbi:polyphosphate kinase [Chryseobacterium arachidis]|uniref:Polyphosphate kinase n=1 Tax=Chryseobacterium arachidis TaxID=1416778 RepID=A0A1M5BXE4_9FLAO|nr:polyphosphate kinase 1 [Chryseobacterium arachidis]SHF47040.1 polyphosphate kinase [Chryseobacterium arachidis]
MVKNSKKESQAAFPAELSWLSFNNSVLEEAADTSNPLYERIKFLAIHSSNLDEFYRVKVNNLLIRSGSDKKLLKQINREIAHQQEQFGKIWNKKILKELAENRIIYYENQAMENVHLDEIESYFKSKILSYIQLVYLSKEPSQEYFLKNRQLYFLVKLKEGNTEKYCYVNIPSDKLSRYVLLSKVDDKDFIISLDTIVKKCLHYIFIGQEILGVYAIKINRDENYLIEDETSGNLVFKIKKKIEERKSGVSTRFLYDLHMPSEMLEICRKAFRLKDDEIVKGGTHHNFFDLFKFPNPQFPALQNKPYPAIRYLPFENKKSIFENLTEANHLLSFPYHSYHYVLQLFNEAAVNNDVTDIKVTLYRISSQSLIANALISAAKNGKKVTVFVEVKARFDESNNLFWAQEMKNAGITIIYSMPNLKVHAKTALFTLKPKNKKAYSYAYISTGNFNESTAGVYSDFGFFTSDRQYTDDLKQVFKFLKTKKSEQTISHLWVSGFNLKEKILEQIDTEIQNKKNGKEAAIFIKANGLDEKSVIKKLSEASNAGVPITLIIRGICTLLPGIPNFSENIKIYRIVDMFLEHSRIYKFHNDGDEKTYLSSADMLSRNLNRRIEIAFPISDRELKEQLNTIIDYQLRDNSKKRTLNSKGVAVIEENDDAAVYRAQADIYEFLKT